MNRHDVFNVSQLRKYIVDLSHVIQLDDVQVRANLTVEASPLRIKDREVKHLRGKVITSVKVVWGGPSCGIVTWEIESRMRESYPELFPPGNSRGRKLCKWGRVVTREFLYLYF